MTCPDKVKWSRSMDRFFIDLSGQKASGNPFTSQPYNDIHHFITTLFEGVVTDVVCPCFYVVLEVAISDIVRV